MTVRVVTCGGDAREAWLHQQAWDAAAGAVLAGSCSPWGVMPRQAFADFQAVLADPGVDAVDLLGSGTERLEMALQALAAGKHVILACPTALRPEDGARLLEASRRVRRLVASYQPWLAFPPVAPLRAMVQDRTVGRVTMLRMRSLLAGKGGWDPALNPQAPIGETAEAPVSLAREIEEKLSLASCLLGPIESVHAMQGRSQGPRTTVVTWKHRAHGSYGVLELVEAPDMLLRSRYDSRDDHLEMTGSAGIIWLTKGPGQLRQQPTIQVYRGDDLFAPGNLDDDWLSGHRHCADQLAASLARGKGPGLLDRSMVSHIAQVASLGLEGNGDAGSVEGAGNFVAV
jgi:predicted dehydrogenase